MTGQVPCLLLPHQDVNIELISRWKSLCEGPLPEDLLHEASGLESRLTKEATSWPIVGKAGELAALMGMVSNHEVSCQARLYWQRSAEMLIPD